jgi:hypothetical protein
MVVQMLEIFKVWHNWLRRSPRHRLTAAEAEESNKDSYTAIPAINTLS